MRRTTAYLAHPIDQATGHHGSIEQITRELTRRLTGSSWNVYRPGGAWTVSPDLLPGPELEDVNNYALFNAGLVVAYLPAGVPTVGVPMEIERALVLHIPVVVVTPLSDKSYSLARRDGLRVYSEHLLHDPDDKEWDRAMSWAYNRAKQETSDALRVVLTHNGANVPARAYEDDAGVDLHLAEDIEIQPGSFLDLLTTVNAVQLPDGHWGMITGRSSTLRKHRLHVPLAVIDPGWRGPLFVGAWNLGGLPVKLHAGDRIGQLILMPNNPAPVQVVDRVDNTPRGTNGFGSSG